MRPSVPTAGQPLSFRGTANAAQMMSARIVGLYEVKTLLPVGSTDEATEHPLYPVPNLFLHARVPPLNSKLESSYFPGCINFVNINFGGPGDA